MKPIDEQLQLIIVTTEIKKIYIYIRDVISKEDRDGKDDACNMKYRQVGSD